MAKSRVESVRSAPKGSSSATLEPKPRRGGAAPNLTTMDEALAYLNDRVNLESFHQTGADKRHYRLDRMRALLHALGNPQDSVRHVHVAGTKGKGSTCWMTAAGLEGCGYTVGLYTSPHLVDIRERIAINRKPVSEADFVLLAQSLAKAAAKVETQHGPSTFFELTTAMGFLHFAEQAVDVGVIEVGLGGLLDCTNVITPEVAAVSFIGIDHTAILGSTVEEIAAQKAGIYKPGVPALTIEQDEKVLNVLRESAAKVGAPFQVVGTDIDFSYRFEFSGPASTPQARIQLATEHSEYDYVPVPLAGEHQARNCGLALSIIDKLCERGFDCPQEKVIAGLGTTRVPGRFELVGGSGGGSGPKVLLDGAHNPESIRLLTKTISQYLQYEALVVIFGCAADKDIPPMLKALSMAADKVIFTRAEDNRRAADPAMLGRKYHEIDGKNATVTNSLPEALDVAKRAITSGHVLCITGSFYLVGEAKRMLAERAKQAVRR